jgi:rubrerythrin
MARQNFANDLDVLNYALTLEHLEAAFYNQVNAAGVLTGNAAAYLRTIGDHENAHVEALTNAISAAGGTPVGARSSYNFDALGADLSTQAGILTAAEVLERTGVGAYNGAATAIQNKDILSTAGGIVQVEANHHSIIRVLIDPNTSPTDPFGPVLTPDEVLNAVTPLLGPA